MNTLNLNLPLSLLTICMGVFFTSCQDKALNVSPYAVNSATSKALWAGHSKEGSHTGSFDVNGELSVDNDGTIKSGNFTIPIASIVNFDLPDPLKQQLVEHLQSADFFDVVLNPEASFQLTDSKPYKGNDTAAVKDANYMLTGNFKMNGQTHPVSFPAKVTHAVDSLKADAKFRIDRTKWGMKSYADPKEKMYIYPETDIVLHIAAGQVK